MGILKFIDRVCVQTAIYWEPGETDQYGQMKFKDPVEVRVRWDGLTEVLSTNNGQQFISAAQIMSPTKLAEKGLLRLGKFEDIPDQTWINQSGGNLDPTQIPDTYEIKKVQETPLFRSSDKFVRLYYL